MDFIFLFIIILLNAFMCYAVYKLLQLGYVSRKLMIMGRILMGSTFSMALIALLYLIKTL